MMAALLCMSGLALAAEKPLVEGNPASLVRVIIYEDLQCPDCAAFRKMMDEHLLPRFKDNAAFEHRDFPLAKHAWARKAAIAARFFQDVRTELGLEFRRWAMANLRQITAESFNDRLAAFARERGVDPARAMAALNDPSLAAAVERDYQEGVARGIARTPTVLVDGEPFIEHFPLEDIAGGIERAIAANK